MELKEYLQIIKKAADNFACKGSLSAALTLFCLSFTGPIQQTKRLF